MILAFFYGMLILGGSYAILSGLSRLRFLKDAQDTENQLSAKVIGLKLPKKNNSFILVAVILLAFAHYFPLPKPIQELSALIYALLSLFGVVFIFYFYYGYAIRCKVTMPDGDLKDVELTKSLINIFDDELDWSLDKPIGLVTDSSGKTFVRVEELKEYKAKGLVFILFGFAIFFFGIASLLALLL